MKLVLGLALLAFSQARHTTRKCDNVIVHNIHHEKEILVSNKDSPYQLAIDYNTNTLFFSYTNHANAELFTSAYVDLKTNEYNDISDINGGFASAVDNQNHIVYLGGSDGLYKFNYETKTAKHVDGTEHSIWQLFFKNDVYYTTYPNEHVYVFKNGKTEQVAELSDTKAMLVALNNDLDFYFSNSSGIFKRTKLNSNTIVLGDHNANSMTADDNGNLYFSTPNGIYFINEKDKINEIASMPNIYGVAIERDGNIIYASQNAIVRLKPTKSPCHVDENNSEENNGLV